MAVVMARTSPKRPGIARSMEYAIAAVMAAAADSRMPAWMGKRKMYTCRATSQTAITPNHCAMPLAQATPIAP